jgi:hypothetical protein
MPQCASLVKPCLCGLGVAPKMQSVKVFKASTDLNHFDAIKFVKKPLFDRFRIERGAIGLVS